jgi:hypothetical protein
MMWYKFSESGQFHNSEEFASGVYFRLLRDDSENMNRRYLTTPVFHVVSQAETMITSLAQNYATKLNDFSPNTRIQYILPGVLAAGI